MDTKSTLATKHQPNSTKLPPTPTFHTAYGPKLRIPIDFTGPGKTKQSFKDECNINVIMARYMKTGVIDFVSKHQGRYGDVTSMDFQESMQKVARAQTMFQELPSSIRNRFDNNPAQFLDFVQNPNNAEELHKMGLMKPDYVPPSKRPKDAPTAPPGAANTPPEGGEKPGK